MTLEPKNIRLSRAQLDFAAMVAERLGISEGEALRFIQLQGAIELSNRLNIPMEQNKRD